MEIVNINTLYSYRIGTYILKTKYKIKQYYEFSRVLISREEDNDGIGYLFAYGYSDREYSIIWKFSEKNVFAISRIYPELKAEQEFISQEHFNKYKEKYFGKELLQVFSSDWPYDFRFVVDAITGEIYDKMESR